jgi:serine/threonine-protein phosphatase 2B catalytic subunit
VRKFLDANNLTTIVRGHSAQKYGFAEHKYRANHKFPSVITIFSAPNYCDKYENLAAYMEVFTYNFFLFF